MEHAEWQRFFFEESPDALSAHAEDGQFLSASAASDAVLGWSSAALIGRRLHELVHPEDAEHLSSGWGSLRSGTAIASVRYRLR